MQKSKGALSLSKRVRQAFKKCPYLERSKDLRNEGVVSVEHAKFGSLRWLSWVLHFATFTPFHTVSWPNLICCLLIGLCNQVGRRAPMVQKPQDAKQKKFGKVRRNFVPQVPPAQGQQRSSMSVKAKCFLS